MQGALRESSVNVSYFICLQKWAARIFRECILLYLSTEDTCLSLQTGEPRCRMQQPAGTRPTQIHFDRKWSRGGVSQQLMHACPAASQHATSPAVPHGTATQPHVAVNSPQAVKSPSGKPREQPSHKQARMSNQSQQAQQSVPAKCSSMCSPYLSSTYISC